MADPQQRSNTPPVLRLPELAMRRVFQYLVDLPAFEWFEDPSALKTWDDRTKQLVRLLGVCRYWRGVVCPLYYQFASRCFGGKGYCSVPMARYKARIDEIAAPHLRAMVKYVYLNLNIDSLMSERWQEILDMVLGDAVYSGAQQLVIDVDMEKGSVDQQVLGSVETARKRAIPTQKAPRILPEEIKDRIDLACDRLRVAFPNVVAAQVCESRGGWRDKAMPQLTRRMLQGRTALSMCLKTCSDLAAPQLVEGGLTWIRVERVYRKQNGGVPIGQKPCGVPLIRRCAATLQTIIVTRAPGSVAKDILYDDTGALLVYPKLRELRLDVGGDRKRKSEADFERPDYVPFPVLAQVSVGPGDPHISKLLLRGNRESLVHIRLCLSGRTVTRLHNAGVLDGDEAWPALRHIELYRPALGMESDQYGDGRGSLSRVMFGQLVRWVLTTARDCPRIVLRGWRMELHLGAGELEPLVARLGSTVRHLYLPVVCTVADALGLVKRLPNLDYLGIALDGCMMSGDDIPADEYVRTAVAAQQSRLRTLAVQVDNEAGVLQQRQIALACALAKMTPSAQTLESRCAFREVGSSAPVLDALSRAAEAVRAGLAVKPYTAYPQWQ